MKSVVNGMNVFSCAMRSFLTASLVFAGGCDSGDDEAFEADDGDRGTGLSIMHCKTAAGVGDGSTKFVYETADFMGTDDFVPVHVSRQRPGGVDDYGWIQAYGDPYSNTLSWAAPNKLKMTVFNKADKQASIQVEHAVNGAGKPGIVAKPGNGFCTFKTSPTCGADQRVVCDWGACGCQTVGSAGGWYSADVAGGSVSFALTGMVLVDGPLPVGDVAAIISLAFVGVFVVVANNQDLIQSFAKSIGGKVTSVFDAVLARTAADALAEEMRDVSHESEGCQACVSLCVSSSLFGGYVYDKGALYCSANDCIDKCS